MSLVEFDPPDRFVVGTVGMPGQRTFFVQAAGGGRLVSAALEKLQVQALAERVGDLLDEMVGPAVVDAVDVDNEPLTTPIEEERHCWSPVNERTSENPSGRLRGGALVATVMLNLGLERYLTGRGLRLELAGDQPVLRPQQRLHQRRRAGIGTERARRIEGCDRVEIGREQRAQRRVELALHQKLDAVAPFQSLAGLHAAEIVEARAGMGVDDAERRRLVAQMCQHAAQRGVLHDVGEVAGVIGVSVVHRARPLTMRRVLCIRPGAAE